MLIIVFAVNSKDPLTGLKEETKRDILNSELWMTLFRGGFTVGKLQRSFSMKHVSMRIFQQSCSGFTIY
jgi:hypothetical protein